uniref:3beta-hydroxysteroid-dehydrogenase/decarboxylase isoform 3-like isoform X2 n=1 Tax=Rhizophora mucronata TaxID=61149 RepID=A0A2P2L7G0_RHIMU
MSDCVVDPFVCCNRKRAKTPIFSNLLTRQVSCGYSGGIFTLFCQVICVAIFDRGNRCSSGACLYCLLYLRAV